MHRCVCRPFFVEFLIGLAMIAKGVASTYSAPSIIRKSITSIIRKIRHIHWELGKLSVYLAVSCLNRLRQPTAKYTDSFPSTQ